MKGSLERKTNVSSQSGKVQVRKGTLSPLKLANINVEGQPCNLIIALPNLSITRVDAGTGFPSLLPFAQSTFIRLK